MVTAQAALLLKGGGCGVAASPPHHTPQFPCMLSSYKLWNYLAFDLLSPKNHSSKVTIMVGVRLTSPALLSLCYDNLFDAS